MQERRNIYKIEQLNLLQVVQGLRKRHGKRSGLLIWCRWLVPLRKRRHCGIFEMDRELYLPQECVEHCIKMFQVVIDPEAGCTAPECVDRIK
jgi:hypothetical protein